MIRLIWAIIGALAMGLAVIGAVLPIMPTVPFLLVAAYGFARSSPRFHHWLMTHPVFGPQLHAWQQHRAIPRRVKKIAIGSMGVGLCVGFVLLSWPLWIMQVVVIAGISTFIATRPTPPEAVLTTDRQPSRCHDRYS